MLAHYSNITPTTALIEPLYSNLFEISFTFPPILGVSGEMEMMLIQAKNIKLELTPDLKSHEQYFKYSGRQYLNTNKENSIIKDLSIDFNINVADNFSITTWNMLKKWYDLGWNSQNGSLSYKRDMVGSIVAHIHDRRGVVVRRVEFINVQLKNIKGMDFAWDKEEILDTSAKFIADGWIDSYFDII